jgi:RNA polymerase sigma-70 factor (ECF subfamily)
VIAGSHKDFTALYNIYALQLYAFVFKLVKSRSRAKEIVQDTFIRIWTKREQIDETLPFKSYLFTIARNCLLNEFRKQMTDPVFSDYMQLGREEPFSENTVEQKIDFDEFTRQLQHSKKKLPPRQRQIFEMNKEQGLAVKEIAQSLQISEQVVRNQLSAALHTLRDEIGKHALCWLLVFILRAG